MNFLFDQEFNHYYNIGGEKDYLNPENRISEKYDNFQDISIPVRNKTSLNCLENAISNFLKPEKLEHDNMYFCNNCDKKVNINILFIKNN